MNEQLKLERKNLHPITNDSGASLEVLLKASEDSFEGRTSLKRKKDSIESIESGSATLSNEITGSGKSMGDEIIMSEKDNTLQANDFVSQSEEKSRDASFPGKNIGTNMEEHDKTFDGSSMSNIKMPASQLVEILQENEGHKSNESNESIPENFEGSWVASNELSETSDIQGTDRGKKGSSEEGSTLEGDKSETNLESTQRIDFERYGQASQIFDGKEGTNWGVNKYSQDNSESIVSTMFGTVEAVSLDQKPNDAGSSGMEENTLLGSNSFGQQIDALNTNYEEFREFQKSQGDESKSTLEPDRTNSIGKSEFETNKRVKVNILEANFDESRESDESGSKSNKAESGRWYPIPITKFIPLSKAEISSASRKTQIRGHRSRIDF
ncbi:uncharacterized protein [Euwallacea similis]|uniref:uncharacterized protein n=1 Tax=Euwallacea similis TaxID=1736056 RepID=UPI00344B3DA7